MDPAPLDAAEALRRLPMFLDALHHEPNFVCEPIVEAIASLGPAVVPRLMTRLRDISLPPHVRGYIADSLAEIGDPRATDALIAVLDEEDIDLCISAPIALSRMPGLAWERIRDLLDDPRWRVRASAALVLGELGDPQALPSLWAALRDDNPQVVWVVLGALAKIPDVRTVPEVLPCMQAADATVRRAAADTLGHLGDRRGLPALLLALDDSEPLVRRYAANALKQLGAAAARPALLQHHDDPDPEVRAAIAAALIRCGAPGVPHD
jgi:HEAT repeat protein